MDRFGLFCGNQSSFLLGTSSFSRKWRIIVGLPDANGKSGKTMNKVATFIMLPVGYDAGNSQRVLSIYASWPEAHG